MSAHYVVHAEDVSVVETRSAMIKPDSVPDSARGGGCYISNINPAIMSSYCAGNPQPGYPTAGLMLWHFDLGAYTGRTVVGNGQISCGQVWGESIMPHYYFRVYPCLSNWSETPVTWQTLLGPGMTNMVSFQANFSTWFGPAISMADIDGSSMARWTIPSNVVQGWLNSPTGNFGVAVKPDGPGNKMLCNRAWWATNMRPVLTFSLASSSQKPNTPVNLWPTNGTIGQPLEGLQLIASPFSDPNGHAFSNSQWQVSTDVAFSSPVWDSWIAPAATSALVQLPLQHSTRHYWRVRYRNDNAGAPEWSTWSAPTYFETVPAVIMPVTKVESRSAMIAPGRHFTNEPPDFSYANSNFNGSSSIFFNPVNPATNIAPAGVVMYWFDLGMYAAHSNLQLRSHADLAIGVQWVDTNYPATYSACLILQPWQETNVTWNNFIGTNWNLWHRKFVTV